MNTEPRGLWKGIACVMPSVGALLLPKCPFCFLALAALLNAVGIDGETYQQAFLPVLVVLLSAPVLLLGLRRTGSARIQTVLFMVSGAGLYVTARLEEWHVAFQVAAAALYCLGAFSSPRQKRRCCVRQTSSNAISMRSAVAPGGEDLPDDLAAEPTADRSPSCQTPPASESAPARRVVRAPACDNHRTGERQWT